MSDAILICSDLDRTLLPNGTLPESAAARPLLRQLPSLEAVTLAYVSGRNQSLLQAAIDTYQLPMPAFAVGDVGTSIFYISDQQWLPDEDWQQEIAPDFNGHDSTGIHSLLTQAASHDADNLFEHLQLQAPEQQNRFKLSYYAPPDMDEQRLRQVITAHLAPHGIAASIIFSIDEATHTGLVDILPRQATKRHAVEYLMRRLGFPASRTAFAGDSGNDLPVLLSGLQAILVGNADEALRQRVRHQAQEQGIESSVYYAKGDFLGMNGHYAAGVLEGVCHFFPEYRAKLEAAHAALPLD